MMNKKGLLGGVLLSVAIAASALAAKPTFRKNESRVPGSADPVTIASESRWMLFGGIDLGISNYSTYNNSTTEASRSGFDGGVRLLVTHYWDQWAVDAGLGYQIISNKGTNADSSVNSDSTRNAYLDFSPRYRAGPHWQIGPEFEYWLGTDKGLNPTVPGSDVIAETNNSAFFAGVQAVYEWMDPSKYRVGARALTDLNVDGRTVNVFQVFVQMGFDVFGGTGEAPARKIEQVSDDDLDRASSKYEATPLAMATPAATPWPEPAQALVISTPAEPVVTPTPWPKTPEPVLPRAQKKNVLTLDVNDLPFGYNDARLPPGKALRVKKIGAFLKKNSKSWKRVTVSGHTDERGSKAYNINLSKRRAETVKKLLIQGGAPAARVRAVGLGEDYPIDRAHSESAWAKNRRVELEFRGMKDVVLLRKAMDQ